MYYKAAQTQEKSNIQDILICFLSSMLLSLFAKITIPLWFTPVPLVLQNSIAIMLGLFLGGRKGLYATLAFLFYGACNLPVFSTGGSGILWLLGPTGGYLFGYAIGSFITGKVAHQIKNKSPLKLFLAVMLGHIVILTIGSLWLGINYVGLNKSFLLGILPFVLGDVFKSLVIVKLFDRITKRQTI